MTEDFLLVKSYPCLIWWVFWILLVKCKFISLILHVNWVYVSCVYIDVFLQKKHDKKDKKDKYFIFNHLSFVVYYHQDPVSTASRIVGFEVAPQRSVIWYIQMISSCSLKDRGSDMLFWLLMNGSFWCNSLLDSGVTLFALHWSSTPSRQVRWLGGHICQAKLLFGSVLTRICQILFAC